MARFKPYSYDQLKLVPVSFERQILPGTFEATLSRLIDEEIDLSVFQARYRNDEVGAPAYDPAILLKVILYAYARGVTSSREIARLERAVEHLLRRHREADAVGDDTPLRAARGKQIDTLQTALEKVRGFLQRHADKVGPSGRVKKSNLTDNDSAKMKTSKGVIQ